MTDPVAFTQAIIRCPSITPKDAGVLAVLENELKALGFTCHRVTFSDAPGEPTENLYARFGTQAPNLCFAGHVDVVPPGDLKAWPVDPFAAIIEDGYLIGRGAEDMKGAIGSFVAACGEFVKQPFNGSISLLITGDEEGLGTNGTKKMLPWLKEKGEVIDCCIVGEPTNPTTLGEMAKIGRRGSGYGHLIVHGKQGHAAYPELAENPITRMVAMLGKLMNTQLDGGSDFFPPSHLEVTSMDVGNPTGNVIPAEAQARFNIRFNEHFNAKTLEQWVRTQLDSVGGKYTLNWRVSGEAFVTPPGRLSGILQEAVKEITGITPVLSTTGGTSDARYIKDICPLVEFGTTGGMAHAVGEKVKTDDLIKLRDIYLSVMKRFFTN